MPQNLTPIQRVESKAPLKNTIEWEIPNSVLASLMTIGGVGYMFIAKVKTEKKHWWNKKWKTYTKRAANPVTAVFSRLEFLQKFGYTIDHNSIGFGERIGEPDYFNKANQQNIPDQQNLLGQSKKQILRDEEDIAFFKNNVVNWQQIEKAGATLPIRGHHVGLVTINDFKKSITIEIRQTDIRGEEEQGEWCQVPYYGEGHLLCEDVEYKKVATDINGGVFLLFNDKKDPSKLKLMLNHNRKGIEIICSKISVIDFKKISVDPHEYIKLDAGLKIGRFFDIKQLKNE